ncbi:MAG: ArsC/Spx/MgsR family protein [Sulfitobacter sp.]
MLIYGLKNCDTCRKAMKALPDATLVDVRTDGIPDAVLDAALAQFGDTLLNTRSTTWRGLTAQQREDDPRSLLRAHPTVMKRPLIAVDNTFFLSWSKDVEAEVKAAL